MDILSAMKDVPFDPSAEPFGQRGVLPYVWPTFVLLCAIGLCTCLLMLQRSVTVWDTVSVANANRNVVVSSVIGRLVLTVTPPNGTVDSSQSVWDFDSRNFESVTDGWAEGWQKVLGIQWGYERAFQLSRQPTVFWRLRVRWRTLAILYAVPVGIELVRRFRRRSARPAASAELNQSVVPSR